MAGCRVLELLAKLAAGALELGLLGLEVADRAGRALALDLLGLELLAQVALDALALGGGQAQSLLDALQLAGVLAARVFEALLELGGGLLLLA